MCVNVAGGDGGGGEGNKIFCHLFCECVCVCGGGSEKISGETRVEGSFNFW